MTCGLACESSFSSQPGLQLATSSNAVPGQPHNLPTRPDRRLCRPAPAGSRTVPEVRLVNGTTAKEGRVEVRMSDGR